MTGHNRAIPAVIGRRIQRERERREWSLRDLAAKSEVSASTVMRAEKGNDFALSHAIRITEALGMNMGALLADPECNRCDDMPPAGFICAACKQEGPP